MKEDKKDRPFVFVRCLTYNHELYIEDTLKGFAMQKTDFPFLAVVIDDCSTDRTADIVRKYEAMYPDKIKGIYLPHNFRQTREDKRPYYQEYVDKAKYWAECEGDDYWTDPMKLQKQVDFLEENEDYALSFHDASIIDEDGNLIVESKMERYYTNEMCRDWSAYDLMCGYTPPTPATVYRMSCYNKAIKVLIDAKNIVNSDTVLASIMGKYGKGKFQDDIKKSVCRVHSGGIWQKKSELYKNQSHYNLYTFLQRIHKRNKYVNEHMNNTRFNIVKRIIRISIAEKEKRIFFKYYVILWMLMLKKFNMKTMYVVNRDIVHWIRVRNVKQTLIK
jgi:glycosyltransferase involved in cell wall biosynthesis